MRSLAMHLCRLIAFLTAIAVPIEGSFAQGNVIAGKSLFAVCAGCHGLQGEGNEDVPAPKLAGQEDWYLSRQMRYFLDGVRGSDSNDIHGARMATMAGALRDERAIADVTAFIGTLPDTLPRVTLAGDPANGQSLYAICGACHGAGGEGNAGLSSPRLIRMDDWYIAAQLRAYLDGTRGTHPDDSYGRQMAPIVGVLTSQQAIADVVAYINSLN